MERGRGLEGELLAVGQDVTDFWVEPRLPILDMTKITGRDRSLFFAREVFSRHHPALLRGMARSEVDSGPDYCPALHRWGRDYLVRALGEKLVSVNLTADGRADSVQPHSDLNIHLEQLEPSPSERYFIYPAEAQMTLGSFFDLLDRRLPRCVAYLSQQNDNLRQQLPELLQDVPLLSFDELANDVFGSPQPEAINLWIGDERSVSSLHKDHFENLYLVVSGEKTFTLLPPTDILYMPEEEFPCLKYRIVSETNSDNASEVFKLRDTEHFQLQLTKEGVPSDRLTWIPLDPNDPDVCSKHPKFQHTHPIQCTVRAGEVLYIPSMWYHRVSQTTTTIAVNYWYDQRFDFRFVSQFTAYLGFPLHPATYV